jgi:hypothetical protein
MTEAILHKEIDLIQGVINRMANNSFLLKGWLISLVALVLAITKETIVATQLSYFSLLLCLPVVLFWYLDAFFLHKEKCYIKMYNWVIENRKTTEEHSYCLDYRRYENKVDCVFIVMLSKTIIPFYGLVLFILLILTFHNYIF